ncbi:ELWxxDGT repeat protein [Winogradskyella tangerina]|uniref:ELWxxDGT repeat protein n=1 Tax=Winogradskyella tangerina TaxID=2023240 RepID=UPI000DBE2712|nr:ELWxxDGT repeat protein [Winogradskyella tangerina]
MKKYLLFTLLTTTILSQAQVSLVLDINPTGDGVAVYPNNRISYNGSLLFAADNGVNGMELWISDGTENGTFLLRNINNAFDSNPNGFYLMPTDGRVYFSASGLGEIGVNPNFELMVTDGTTSGTIIHREFNQENFQSVRGSDPSNITSLNDKLIFSARFRWLSANIDWGTEYCFASTLSNGTTPSTSDGFGVNLNAGASSSLPSNFVEFNGDMYFSATSSSGANFNVGRELWRTNGVPGTSGSGTALGVDANPGPDSSNPENLFVYNNRLYFTANVPGFGNEIFRITSNGNLTNLKNISSGAASSDASNFTIMNGTIFFTANDGINGREIWSSTGFPSTTNLLSNINPTGNSNPNELFVFNGKLYFSADNGTNGVELWVSDGTNAGTQMLADINPTGESTPQGFTEYNGKLYFNADDGVNGRELWVTDGTTVGTQLVEDIWTGVASSDPLDLIVVNNILFFSANNGSTGYELFKYEDPTLSVNNQELYNTVTFSPNPTISSFTLNTNQTISYLNIFNLRGQLVKSFIGSQNDYNIEDLNSGIYLVTLQTKNGSITKKLIKE